MPARHHASGAQFQLEPDDPEIGLHRVRTPTGRLPDALKPGFHSVRTHWNRGFMAFRLAEHTRTVMPVVPA